MTADTAWVLGMLIGNLIGLALGADAVRDQVLAILDGIAGSPGLSPCFLDALRLAVRSAGVKG